MHSQSPKKRKINWQIRIRPWSLFHLPEAKRERKGAEAALEGAEKQAEEMQVSLKKTKTQLALAKEQIKLQLKDLEGKEAEKAKVE